MLVGLHDVHYPSRAHVVQRFPPDQQPLEQAVADWIFINGTSMVHQAHSVYTH